MTGEPIAAATVAAMSDYNRADPHVVVEVGSERYEAIATPLDGEERDREFAAQVARNPVFGEYEQRTDRVIPVIALTRGTP